MNTDKQAAAAGRFGQINAVDQGNGMTSSPAAALTRAGSRKTTPTNSDMGGPY